MKVIRDRCGFQEGCFVPSIGSNGGLALFWDSKVRIKILGSSLSHIDAIMKGDGNYNPWCLTGFYGNPETPKRMESWQLLNSLSSLSQLSWFVIGDFNEIRCAEEKEGGATRPYQQMAHYWILLDPILSSFIRGGMGLRSKNTLIMHLYLRIGLPYSLWLSYFINLHLFRIIARCF